MGAALGKHTVFQAARDACDFIFKQGSPSIVPGLEELTVHPVFNQCSGRGCTCCHVLKCCHVLVGLSSVWRMISSLPQVWFWLLLSGCLANGRRTSDPQSWLWSQEGYSWLSLSMVLSVNHLALLLFYLLLLVSWSYKHHHNCSPPRSPLFPGPLTWNSSALFQIKSVELTFPWALPKEVGARTVDCLSTVTSLSMSSHWSRR